MSFGSERRGTAEVLRTEGRVFVCPVSIPVRFR